MTERQMQILAAIIEQHAEIAAPVGSVMLAKLFGVSSATIRSEMARLEEMGLIAQPYTSAGRVPTDVGYRFYVNMLTEAHANEPSHPEGHCTGKRLDEQGVVVQRRRALQADAELVRLLLSLPSLRKLPPP